MPYLNELGAKVKEKYPDAYGNQSDLEVGRKMVARYPVYGKKYKGAAPPGWVRPALEALPAVGGAVGGILGGIGASPTVAGVPIAAAGGAALGGAAGEGLKRATEEALGYNYGQPETTAAQEAIDVTKAGATQGMWELGGRWLALGGKLAGRTVMAGALRRAGENAPKIAKTAVEYGIAASRKGANKLNKILEGATAELRSALNEATRRGHLWDSVQMLNGQFRDLYANSQIGNVASAASRELQDLATEFLKEVPQQLNPHHLNQVRQRYDAIANAIHKAAGGGENPAIQQLRKRFAKAIADRARDILHNEIGKDVVAVSEGLTKQSELLALKRVLEPGVKRGFPLAARAAGGVAAGTVAGLAGGGSPERRFERGLAVAAGTTLATSPIVLSWLARHALAGATVEHLGRQTPRAAALAAHNLSQ